MILISVGSVESFLHSPTGMCLTLEATDDCFSSILQWKRDSPAVLRSIYVNFVDFSDDNEEGRQRGACNRISWAGCREGDCDGAARRPAPVHDDVAGVGAILGAVVFFGGAGGNRPAING